MLCAVHRWLYSKSCAEVGNTAVLQDYICQGQHCHWIVFAALKAFLDIHTAIVSAFDSSHPLVFTFFILITEKCQIHWGHAAPSSDFQYQKLLKCHILLGP